MPRSSSGPRRSTSEVICDRDSRDVLPVLDQMVARWRKARAKEAAALKAQCVELAAAIIAKWPEVPHGPYHWEEAEKADPLEAIAALDDPGLIGDFLGDVLIKDATVEPGSSLVKVCQKHGWATFREQLVAVFRDTTSADDRAERPAARADLHREAPQESGMGGALRRPRAGDGRGSRDDRRRRSSDDWRYRERSARRSSPGWPARSWPPSRTACCRGSWIMSGPLKEVPAD